MTWLLASAEGALPILFAFVLLVVIYALTWLALSVGGGEERGRLETRLERYFVRGDAATVEVGRVRLGERGATFRITASVPARDLTEAAMVVEPRRFRWSRLPFVRPRLRDAKIHTTHAVRCDEGLLKLLRASDEAQEAVRTLLGLGWVEEVRLRDGVLSASGDVPGTFGKRPIRKARGALLALVEALSVPLPPSVTLSGERLSGRCPYCHDDLASEPLVTCDACQIALHRECLSENGRCPTLGCGGTEVTRVPAVAS